MINVLVWPYQFITSAAETFSDLETLTGGVPNHHLLWRECTVTWSFAGVTAPFSRQSTPVARAWRTNSSENLWNGRGLAAWRSNLQCASRQVMAQRRPRARSGGSGRAGALGFELPGLGQRNRNAIRAQVGARRRRRGRGRGYQGASGGQPEHHGAGRGAAGGRVWEGLGRGFAVDDGRREGRAAASSRQRERTPHPRPGHGCDPGRRTASSQFEVQLYKLYTIMPRVRADDAPCHRWHRYLNLGTGLSSSTGLPQFINHNFTCRLYLSIRL
eukprot:SAG31_NODE_933_length_10897_cov_15.489442_11_plen_272_part_00